MKKHHRLSVVTAAVLFSLLLLFSTTGTTDSFSPIVVTTAGRVPPANVAAASCFARQQATSLSSSSSSSSLDDGAVLLAETSSSSSSSKNTSTGRIIHEQEQVKHALLDLLPRMTGKAQELKLVEQYVNALEDMYQPVQTLDFLNLLQQGDWQLLFSTNYRSQVNNPRQFRLRELYQTVTCHGLQGTLETHATWDLAEQGDAIFNCTGSFTVENTYTIQQGARMIPTVKDHVLRPVRGSSIPKDVPALVGLLHRSMPVELFDASGHAMDTTFLDANLRIVRYTTTSTLSSSTSSSTLSSPPPRPGRSLEGTRDIFIRRGSLVINPIAAAQ